MRRHSVRAEDRQHDVSRHTLQEFFGELFPPKAQGFVELRALPGANREFVRPGDIESIERFVRTNRDKKGDPIPEGLGRRHSSILINTDSQKTP